jgi:hypothetical protein
MRPGIRLLFRIAAKDADGHADAVNRAFLSVAVAVTTEV